MRFINPGRVDGECRAPSSKSEMQRAVAAAFLAEGESHIFFQGLCEDSKAALDVVRMLGASVILEDGRVSIGGRRSMPAAALDCGESGLCLRMFAPIAALFDREITLTAKGSLLGRPVSRVETALKNAGALARSRNGYPPLTVKGPLTGGRIGLDGSLSSQHVTGFLMALPAVGGNSELVVADLRSSPYLCLTLAVMRAFGVRADADFGNGRFAIPGGQAYRPGNHRIEGDWSAAAFLLVAGAVAGRVTVTDLDLESHQADREIIDVLKGCGADVSFGRDSVSASRRPLSAFDFDAVDAPDLIPPLAVLACYCRGTSRIGGAGRLRHKESDRAQALVDTLGRMGGRVRIEGDHLLVTGTDLRGGRVGSHRDHRIAMAAAVAALGSGEGAEIEEPECVAKSYPRFFHDLEQLKAGG